MQPCRLQRQVQPRRIRAAHNRREPVQSRAAKIILPQEGIEAAAIAVVTGLDARDVVRRGPRLAATFSTSFGDR